MMFSKFMGIASGNDSNTHPFTLEVSNSLGYQAHACTLLKVCSLSSKLISMMEPLIMVWVNVISRLQLK